MKIDPNMIIGAVTGKAPAAAKGPAAGSNLFEDILNGVQKTGTVQAQGVSPLLSVNQVSPQAMRCMSVTDQAMGMLDAYSKSLLDPKVSLRDLAPMVEELGALRTEVLEAGSFLSDSDPLKGIMDEVASTINAEVVRFRRGDLTG
ncbi:MAG TPA: hypothetical protein PKM41_09655 [Deltaproteobacteria bacterium]|jgi:hypothetical protein|nr:hypothetical protein [Deltaproteobacteria bacterium]HOI07745.1 hypothetical protein [Deltaproteobacteria bacterium]